MLSRSSRKTRRGGANKVNKGTRKSLTVKDFRVKFAKLDGDMRKFIKENNLNNPKALVKQVSRNWANIFNKNLSGKAANSLANHYANLHGNKNKKTQKGGSLNGAPLDYVMRPGMPGVATYGVFPIEAGADVKASGHLDVYYNTAMGKTCGMENTTATVPSSIGTNLVSPAKGGARRNRRRTLKGSGYITALEARPWTPSAIPATGIQIMSEKWMGQPAFARDTSDPSAHAYSLAGDTRTPLMDPNGITPIDKDITQMANPSPYPAVKL
jgi:hypothetical protein